MPDRTPRTDTLRAGAPLRAGAVTLFPIERITVASWTAGQAAWVLGAKEPHAVVLRDPAGTRAVDGTGCAVPLEDLCARVPGLLALLSDA